VRAQPRESHASSASRLLETAGTVSAGDHSPPGIIGFTSEERAPRRPVPSNNNSADRFVKQGERWPRSLREARCRSPKAHLARAVSAITNGYSDRPNHPHRPLSVTHHFPATTAVARRNRRRRAWTATIRRATAAWRYPIVPHGVQQLQPAPAVRDKCLPAGDWGRRAGVVRGSPRRPYGTVGSGRHGVG
jgi:hypothetical protein